MKKIGVVFLLVLSLTVGNFTNVNAQILSKGAAITKITPINVDVIAKGPGALYIAQVNNDLVFWVVNSTDNKVVRIAEIPLTTTPASTRIVNTKISDGISGVFYADNLTFSSSFTLKLSGKLENKDCPLCTVSMPLNSDTNFNWIAWLTPIGTTAVPIVAGDKVSEIVKKQNEIYAVVEKTMKDVDGLKNDFVNMQTDSLVKYYQEVDKSYSELETKTQNAFTTMKDFEDKLKNKGADDSTKIQKEGQDFDDFAKTEFPKFELGFQKCGKLGLVQEKTNKFIEGLKLDTRDSTAGDNSFDEKVADDPSSTTNIDAKVDIFSDEMMDDLDDIEPCIDALIANVSEIGNNDPNSPMSEDAKQQMVNAVDYVTLGKQMEDFALNTEKDIDLWSASLEARFNNLDKLEVTKTSGGTSPNPKFVDLSKSKNTILNTQISTKPKAVSTYFDLLNKTKTVGSPILNYLSKKSLGASPSTNVPFSFDLKQAIKAVGTMGQTAGASSSPCGSGKYVTIDLGGASIIIGTFWNDQITADNKINFIFGLAGDDCINAEENFDVADGGADNDEIYGKDGHDLLFGDTFGFAQSGNDKIFGGKGESHTININGVQLKFDIGNFISGDGGNDYLEGFGESDPNNKYKYRFADVILGDGFAGNDSGNDFIEGGGGSDFLFGQGKNDEMINSQFGKFEIIADPNVPGVEVSMGSFFAGNDGNDKITGTNTPSGITMTPPLKSIGDVITGGLDDDLINAGDGDDFNFGDKLIAPSSGNDTINAGDGKDFVLAQKGNDVVHGDGGDDALVGNDGTDILYADSGNFSILISGQEDDFAYGDESYDLAITGKGNDSIWGKGGGFDLIVSWDGNDSVWGGTGIDAIFSNDGNDNVFNGEGIVDITFAGKGVDKVWGNQGFDVIFGQQNLGNEEKRCVEKRSEANTEQLFGNEDTDLIFGGMGHETIYGGSGVDLLFGNECDDWIYGENGVDFIFGNLDGDNLFGGPDPDFIAGGKGYDTANGEASLDFVSGGDEPDKLSGGVDSDLISGGNGDDVMNGNGQSDLLIGGNGKDTMYGNDPTFANDGLIGNLLLGGDHEDTIYGSDSADVVLGGNQNDSIDGKGGSDVLIGMAQADTLYGGSGTNLMIGSDGSDTLNGGIHDDFMFGVNDDDTFNDEDGENGFNVSFGQAGNDTFNTGWGRNFTFGMTDNDNFNLCDDAPDKRDFGFGGVGTNSFTRDKSNYKDWTFNGSRSDC